MRLADCLQSIAGGSSRSRRSAGSAQRGRVSLCCAASLALAVGACSDSSTTDDAPGGAASAGGTPSAADMASSRAAPFLVAAGECGAYAHEPCDVLDPTCQNRLAEIAACQWGGQGTPVTLPAINSLSSEEVRERIQMLASSEQQLAAPVQVATNAVLALLGLLPSSVGTPTSSELLASLLLAYYELDSKQTTLVEGASTGDSRTDNALLFHELVHAQQDARYDLGALARGVVTTDAVVALRGVFEGEAQFHQLIFELGTFNLPIDPGSIVRELDAFRALQEAALFADPASAWQRSLLTAPYMYGPYATLDAWSEGGPEAMVQRYSPVPTQSLRMLEAAFDREPTLDPVEPFPAPNVFAAPGAALPVEGDEAYPLLSDRLGAWTVYVLAVLGGKSELAPALALGWRGDQLDVFQLEAGGAAGRLRVYFDTAAHATDFVALISENPVAAVRMADRLVVVTVSEAETPEWLFGPLGLP